MPPDRPAARVLVNGEGVSDVRVEQKQTLSRQEAARFLAQLAEGLGDGGTVTVQLGSSTLELSVADQLRCELEVEVDGDEIELELELVPVISGLEQCTLAAGHPRVLPIPGGTVLMPGPLE